MIPSKKHMDTFYVKHNSPKFWKTCRAHKLRNKVQLSIWSINFAEKRTSYVQGETFHIFNSRVKALTFTFQCVSYIDPYRMSHSILKKFPVTIWPSHKTFIQTPMTGTVPTKAVIQAPLGHGICKIITQKDLLETTSPRSPKELLLGTQQFQDHASASQTRN